MNRDKEWLLKSLEGITLTDDYGNEFNGGYEEGLDAAYELALQLDEQRITQEQAWEVLAPRFSMSAQDLERQVLDGFIGMMAEEIEMESDRIKELSEGIKRLATENEELKSKFKEPEKEAVPKIALATQFGITDYPFGFDVTALSDKSIVYATVVVDGNYSLRPETVLALPGWHQTFLMNTLAGKEVVPK